MEGEGINKKQQKERNQMQRRNSIERHHSLFFRSTNPISKCALQSYVVPSPERRKMYSIFSHPSCRIRATPLDTSLWDNDSFPSKLIELHVPASKWVLRTRRVCRVYVVLAQRNIFSLSVLHQSIDRGDSIKKEKTKFFFSFVESTWRTWSSIT